MLFKLRDIAPNPFRNIDLYPINSEKVDLLAKSIESTEFWDNITARVVNGGNKAEIAFGHHRLAALRKLHPEDKEINLVIRNLDDAMMIKLMAHENMADWSSTAYGELEVVQAVVQAFATGKIELEKPAATLGLRRAPGFTPLEPGDTDGLCYSPVTVSRFLGWTRKRDNGASHRVMMALQTLELIEKQVLKIEEFLTLTPYQGWALTEETRVALKLGDSKAQPYEERAKKADVAVQQAEKEAKAAATEEAKVAALAKLAKAEAAKASAKNEVDAIKKEHRDLAQEVAANVSDKMKKGEVTTKKAKSVTREVMKRASKGAPPDINAVTDATSTELSKYLHPAQNERVDKINELIRFCKHINRSKVKNLITNLRTLAKRSTQFADKLEKAIDTKDQKVVDKVAHKLLENKKGEA